MFKRPYYIAVALLAVLSMFLGAIAAIGQRDIKRAMRQAADKNECRSSGQGDIAGQ